MADIVQRSGKKVKSVENVQEKYCNAEIYVIRFFLSNIRPEM